MVDEDISAQTRAAIEERLQLMRDTPSRRTLRGALWILQLMAGIEDQRFDAFATRYVGRAITELPMTLKDIEAMVSLLQDLPDGYSATRLAKQLDEIPRCHAAQQRAATERANAQK